MAMRTKRVSTSTTQTIIKTSRMARIIAEHKHRRCASVTSKGKMKVLIMMQQLLIFMVLNSLAFSTTMVSSKSPSLIPRQHKIIRNVSSSSSSSASNSNSNSNSNQQLGEAPWISGFKNSLASGLAAGCSKLILAPFDTIKTLQQSSLNSGTAAGVSNGLSMTGAVQAIMNRPRGFVEFYSGVGVAVVGSMPSVGLYFGIYSYCKKSFQKWDPEHYEQRQTLYIALSAAIGNTIASASRVPYEVVKQKFQTKVYTTMGDAIRDMSLKTLFPTGGIASQMLRDIPYAIVTLLTYEHLKSVWKTRAQNKFPTVPVRGWDMLVGGLSGGVGSYLTNPMDVLKTRLQTDASSTLYGGSIRTCAELTLKEGGPAAFMRGSLPRLLHKVPANAFFFLFYEFFRSVLKVQDDTTATATTNKTVKR